MNDIILRSEWAVGGYRCWASRLTRSGWHRIGIDALFIVDNFGNMVLP